MFGNSGQTTQFRKLVHLTAYVTINIELNIKFLYTEQFKYTYEYSMLERQYSSQSVIVDFSFAQFISVFVDRQYSPTLLV